MENEQPKTGKFSLTYGAIAGGIGIIFGIMLYTMDMHYERGAAVQATQILILAGVIGVGISQFKKANENYLNLSEALKLGAGIA